MKRFSIQQIRYKWILLISILFFFLTYLFDLLSPREKPVSLFVIGSVVATLIAAVWAIVNYVGHLQVNPLYKTNFDPKKPQPIFQIGDHQYLFFWGSIAVLIGVILFIVEFLIPSLRVVLMIDLGVTLACYGVGFYLSFFMYLLLDKLLGKKK